MNQKQFANEHGIRTGLDSGLPTQFAEILISKPEDSSGRCEDALCCGCRGNDTYDFEPLYDSAFGKSLVTQIFARNILRGYTLKVYLCPDGSWRILSKDYIDEWGDDKLRNLTSDEVVSEIKKLLQEVTA